MNRKINKVAVIGSGIMGSGIACHFANIGIEVLLLDIVPNKLSDVEIKKNLSLEDKTVRNRIVTESLAKAIKSKPSPLYHKNFKNRIATVNLTDDLEKISDSDWIIEVVIENLEIKIFSPKTSFFSAIKSLIVLDGSLTKVCSIRTFSFHSFCENSKKFSKKIFLFEV